MYYIFVCINMYCCFDKYKYIHVCVCVTQRFFKSFLSNCWTLFDYHCPFCCFRFQFLEIGVVTSIEFNHKQVESARKGQEVCIKIEPIPGESPKMYGRHFEETDMLVSKVSESYGLSWIQLIKIKLVLGNKKRIQFWNWNFASRSTIFSLNKMNFASISTAYGWWYAFFCITLLSIYFSLKICSELSVLLFSLVNINDIIFGQIKTQWTEEKEWVREGEWVRHMWEWILYCAWVFVVHSRHWCKRQTVSATTCNEHTFLHRYYGIFSINKNIGAKNIGFIFRI